MASPFKTHETMDLARAMLEEDSSSYTNCAGSRAKMDNNNPDDGHSSKFRQTINSANFDNLVISKDSSTELIPTQLVESSADTAKTNKPALMMIRDMNAGKGILDDDGKPVVGKVFSRVIQIAGGENKPKQLKAHHNRGRSSSTTRDRQGPDKEKPSSTRPQSSNSHGVSTSSSGGGGSSSGSQSTAKTSSRKFSDEPNNIVFCTGSSKDIM